MPNDRCAEHGRNADGVMVCGAGKRKKPGEVCMIAVGLGPNGRCSMYHNGKAAHGPAAANARHGKHFSRLPRHLAKMAQEVRDDMKLADLDNDVAMVQALLYEVQSSLYKGSPLSLWLLVQEATKRLDRAVALNDGEEMSKAIYDISDLVRTGANDARHRKELVELSQTKARLMDSQTKRLVQMSQMMTPDQAEAWMFAVQSAAALVIEELAQLAGVEANEYLQRVSDNFAKLYKGKPLLTEGSGK